MPSNFNYILLFLSFLGAQTAHAQGAGTGFGGFLLQSDTENYDAVSSDLYEDEEYEGEEEDLDQKMEVASTNDREELLALALNNNEIRAQHSEFAGLFVGTAYPWQSVGVEFTNYVNADRAHMFSVGFGDWSFKDSQEEVSYIVDAEANGVFYSQKLFPTDVLPLYFQLTGGWIFWKGEINPSGEFAEDAEISDVLRSGFHANGPIVSAHLGLNVTWKSGWFLEYNLLGVSKGFSTFEDYSSSSSRSRTSIREQIGQVATWGLFNIKFGRAF